MFKFRYAFCCILAIIICSMGVLAGCGGNPLDKLKVTLKGATLADLGGGNYSLTLEKLGDGQDVNWSAEVSADVEGLAGGMSTAVEWNYDSRYIEIKYLNTAQTRVQISGVTATISPTKITVLSRETEKAKAVINVTNVVRPSKIKSAAVNENEFGIPIGVPFSLDPAEMFIFDPIDATIPEYEFTINGIKYDSNKQILITELRDGYVSIIAHPKNKEKYSQELYDNLSYTLNSIRLYTPLSQDNTSIHYVGSEAEVDVIELLKNRENRNSVQLEISAPTAVSCTIEASQAGVLYDRYSNTNGILEASFDVNMITLTGYDSLEDGVDVYFRLGVSGIKNSVVYTKTVRVSITDLPDGIVINNKAGAEPEEIRVSDAYAASVGGFNLTVVLTPASKKYNTYSLTMDNAETAYELRNNLEVDGEPFISGTSYTSGQTLKLRNKTQADGLIKLIVTSNSDASVTRIIRIHMEAGIQEISINESEMYQASGWDQAKVLLQIDKYDIDYFAYKDLAFNVLPASAPVDSQTLEVTSENEEIVTVRINYVNKTINLHAENFGETRVVFTALSGVTYTVYIKVLLNLNEFVVNLSNPEDERLSLGTVQTENIYTLGDIQTTLTNVFITNNTTVSLKNQFFPEEIIDTGLLLPMTFESTNNRVANASRSNQSVLSGSIQTGDSGDTTITVLVEYRTIAPDGISMTTRTLSRQFHVEVFVPIEDFSISMGTVTLLAKEDSEVIKYSAYDTENMSKLINVTVSPSNAYVQANEATWTKVRRNERFIMSSDAQVAKDKVTKVIGSSSVTIESIAMKSNWANINDGLISVVITDLNGVTWSQEVNIEILRVTKIESILVEGYDDLSNQDNSLYFEMSKGGEFEIKLDIKSSNPNRDITNPNIEYIVYDADLLSLSDNSWSPRDADVLLINNNYYRLYERTNPNLYSSNLVGQYAMLTYNNDTGNYVIKPRKAGYSFVFVMPQDNMEKKLSDAEFMYFPSFLKNYTQRLSIRCLSVVVADGNLVPYRLTTAEDVAAIGTEGGIDKKYYLMNDIDMSSYLAKNPNWKPIGTKTKPFVGRITSYGYDFDRATDGKVLIQEDTNDPTNNLYIEYTKKSITGWTLANSYTSNLETGYLYYGIFGVVLGSICNVDFYVNSYTITQNAMTSSNIGQNVYCFGVVVGLLDSVLGGGGEDTSAIMENVGVYCSNLTYSSTLTSNLTSATTVSIGAVGKVAAAKYSENKFARMAKMMAKYGQVDITTAYISVDFGTIVGQNLGNLGDYTYGEFTNFANVSQLNIKSSSNYPSNIGIAVGENYGYAYSINVAGNITSLSDSTACNIGGVFGNNNADISKIGETQGLLSSAIINGIGSVGGIAGVNNGHMSYAYYDIYDLDGELNTGLRGSGNVGGIVGINTGSISYALVQGYNINNENYNIVGSGNVGGLVGTIDYATARLEKSFVHASISASGDFSGGIVGIHKGVIENVYARGLFASTATKKGAFIGKCDNGKIKLCYVEFNTDMDPVGQSLVIAGDEGHKSVFITPGSNATVEYFIKLNNTDGNKNNEDFWFAGSVSLTKYSDGGCWDMDAVNYANGGYPYLIDDEGREFARTIPTSLTLTAISDNRDFYKKNYTKDNNNNIIAEDTNSINAIIRYDDKKVIINYNMLTSKTILLKDLFSLVSNPVISTSQLGVTITSSSSILQVKEGVAFDDTYIQVNGTGTAVLTIVSKQNRGAFDVVQFAIINGFETYQIFDTQNANAQVDSVDCVVRIRQREANQLTIKYLVGGNTQTANNINGGLLIKTDYLNYQIGIDDWSGNSTDGYYYYLTGTNQIVLSSIVSDFDKHITSIVPYLMVRFYVITIDNVHNTYTVGALQDKIVTNETINQLSFNTQIYKGPTAITVGVTDGTSIYAGDKLASTIYIRTDDYDPARPITDYIDYDLYLIGADGSRESDPTISNYQKDGDNNLYTSSEIGILWGEITYDADNELLSIPFTVLLLTGTAKLNIVEETFYTLDVYAKDKTETSFAQVAGLNISVGFSILPQRINLLEIDHFSDVVNSSNLLRHAGELPTNIIIAGEYGLLRITLSPEFLNYDIIEVTSSVVDGGMIVFDQRVVEVSYNGNTQADTQERLYYSYQDGVNTIQNGIRLGKASYRALDNMHNYQIGFDGTFYVRTLISSAYEAGTLFTITVKVHQNGKDYLFTRDLRVYKADVLDISANYWSSSLNKYVVAQGTGGETETLVQNRNELTVTIGQNFINTQLSLNTTHGSIRTNGKKYYLIVDKEQAGQTFKITLVGSIYVSGLLHKVTREIEFYVVDYYIYDLSYGITNNKLSYSYINGKTYNLKVFEGIDSVDDLYRIRGITFDTTDATVKQKIIETINILNGKTRNLENDRAADANLTENGIVSSIDEFANDQNLTGSYFGWYAKRNSTGEYINMINKLTVFNYNNEGKLIDSNGYEIDLHTINSNVLINNRFALLWNHYDGFKLLPNGVSNDSIVELILNFGYNNGEFTLNKENLTGTTTLENSFGIMIDLILDFYQPTSQEHPIPIYNLNDLLNMEDNMDYILLNDITIRNVDWYPINTAINSLNGNGYNIYLDFDEGRDMLYENAGDVGLFGTVSKNTVLKNITFVIKTQFSPQGITGDTMLNVGAIAGTNYGAIYNCVVSNDVNATLSQRVAVDNPTSASAVFNVAGLVGVNSGVITNCRVTGIDISASGNVAGLVVQNKGTISGCYYVNGKINNNANSQEFATSGFVLTNTESGVILGSSAGGIQINGTLMRDTQITSAVDTSGFVFTNDGKISDCYSAVIIYASKSSGFVESNSAGATVARSYSVSDLTTQGTVALSFPFIGVNGVSATDNNNRNKTNGIVDCFYYDTGFASGSLRFEEALPLTYDDFLGTNGTEVFTNYLFSRTPEVRGENGLEKNQEFSGIWIFPHQDNLYFNTTRFAGSFGPVLVNANLITTPKLLLNEIVTSADNKVTYNYTKPYKAYFETNDDSAIPTNYTYDPLIVSNIDQFNDYFDATLDTVDKIGIIDYYDIDKDGENDDNINNVIISDIRVINHLDQNDLALDAKLNSTLATYAGMLEGNGLSFSNLNLAVNDENSNAEILTKTYGLFGYLISDAQPDYSGDYKVINYTGAIKNFDLNVNNVSCAEVSYVGALVGTVYGGNLFNINVVGESSRVIGYNAVGGVAGFVGGTARLVNITCNVGVTANYRADTAKLYNTDLLEFVDSDISSESITVTDVEKLGYAGGLFGIVDLSFFDMISPISTNINEAKIVDVVHKSRASIVGKIVGGIAGLNGTYSVLQSAKNVISASTLLRGYVLAGGLVGQNHGIIKYGETEYDTTIQSSVDLAATGQAINDANKTVFDSGVETVAIGGLVGLNIGVANQAWNSGIISISSSKIAVRNSKSNYVGGLVGLSYGGTLKACFSTSNVLGSRLAYVGGMIGYVGNFSNNSYIIPEIDNPYCVVSDEYDYTTTLEYVVGFNNYLATDFNYYYALKSNQTNNVEGAIGAMIGYCAKHAMINTTHIVSEDPNQLQNPINYYVNQIYANQVSKTVVEPYTSGHNYIDIDEVGKWGDVDPKVIALGQTRGYILNNYAIIFKDWDEYSITENVSCIPDIEQKILPNTFDINSIDDLKLTYWHPDKKYILKTDLDFTNTVYTIIGSSGDAFTGVFDGREHKFSNITINTNAIEVGLFGALDKATIKNLIIEDCNYVIVPTKYAKVKTGILAGTSKNSTIQNIKTVGTNQITTSGAFVGGLVGETASIGMVNKNTITGCYANVELVLTDNNYKNATDVYYGGLVGRIYGGCDIEYNYADGHIRSSMTNAVGNNIANQYVGGFVGEIYGIKPQDATQAVTYLYANASATTLDLEDLSKSFYAGGFAGAVTEGEITGADAMATMNVELDGIKETFYLSGFIGETNSTICNISGVAISTDITIDGTYDTSELTDYCIAGVIGSKKGNITKCYSLASIYNNTDLEADVGFAKQATQGAGSQGVYVDMNYALTSQNNCYVYDLSTAEFIWVGSGLTDENSRYYRVAFGSNLFSDIVDVYNAKYIATAETKGSSKLLPIPVTNATEFNNIFGQEDNASYQYKFYLNTTPLTENVDIISSTAKVFRGFYNGNGNPITVNAYNDATYNNTNISTSAGLFGKILNDGTKRSVVAGVNIRNASIRTSLADTVANFGIVAGELEANAIISNTMVMGDLEIYANGATNIGGIAGTVAGRLIGCGSNLNITVTSGKDLTNTGLGAIKLGGLGGILTNDSITVPAIEYCYTVGKYNVNNINASTGGIFGQASKIYGIKSYDAVDIDSLNLPRTHPIANNYTQSKGTIYYESGSCATTTLDFTAFAYTDWIAGAGDDLLGSSFTKDDRLNYGLPYIRTHLPNGDSNIEGKPFSTGLGTQSNPYKIYSALQMVWALNNTQSKYYILNTDINMSKIDSTRTTGIFDGHLDGNGHYVSGLQKAFTQSIANSASVSKLGFRDLASNINILGAVAGTATQIYVDSNDTTVTVGSGNITESLTKGASFGTVDANNHCFTNNQDVADAYADLDTTIWVEDNGNYMLAAFA